MRALLLSLMVVAAACRGPEREAPRPAEPAREETPVVELTAEGMTNAEGRTAALTPSLSRTMGPTLYPSASS